VLRWSSLIPRSRHPNDEDLFVGTPVDIETWGTQALHAADALCGRLRGMLGCGALREADPSPRLPHEQLALFMGPQDAGSQDDSARRW
jgi:hypothetical protein